MNPSARHPSPSPGPRRAVVLLGGLLLAAGGAGLSLHAGDAAVPVQAQPEPRSAEPPVAVVPIARQAPALDAPADQAFASSSLDWKPLTYVRSSTGDEWTDDVVEPRTRWAMVDTGSAALSSALRAGVRSEPLAAPAAAAKPVTFASLNQENRRFVAESIDTSLPRPSATPHYASSAGAEFRRTTSARPARSDRSSLAAPSQTPTGTPVLRTPAPTGTPSTGDAPSASETPDTVEVPYDTYVDPFILDAPRTGTGGWRSPDDPEYQGGNVETGSGAGMAPEPATLAACLGVGSVLLRRRRRA